MNLVFNSLYICVYYRLYFNDSFVTGFCPNISVVMCNIVYITIYFRQQIGISYYRFTIITITTGYCSRLSNHLLIVVSVSSLKAIDSVGHNNHKEKPALVQLMAKINIY